MTPDGVSKDAELTAFTGNCKYSLLKFYDAGLCSKWNLLF